MKSKPSGFALEQVFIARSSPARSRQLVLGAGGSYLARLDAVNDGRVWIPPQPARAHNMLRREGEKSCQERWQREGNSHPHALWRCRVSHNTVLLMAVQNSSSTPRTLLHLSPARNPLKPIKPKAAAPGSPANQGTLLKAEARQICVYARVRRYTTGRGQKMMGTTKEVGLAGSATSRWLTWPRAAAGRKPLGPRQAGVCHHLSA